MDAVAALGILLCWLRSSSVLMAAVTLPRLCQLLFVHRPRCVPPGPRSSHTAVRLWLLGVCVACCCWLHLPLPALRALLVSSALPAVLACRGHRPLAAPPFCRPPASRVPLALPLHLPPLSLLVLPPLPAVCVPRLPPSRPLRPPPFRRLWHTRSRACARRAPASPAVHLLLSLCPPHHGRGPRLALRLHGAQGENRAAALTLTSD